MPLHYAPGEAYQFDWSHEVILISGVTVTVKVDAVIDRSGALALRLKDEDILRRLRVVRKAKESDRISSFELAPDDEWALAPFSPGQHLPVEMVIPGQPDRIRRS